MPTFPTYDGELPKCLNPLNPRHYLLVLYWVFFRPTALKCYLYQANPEIYKNVDEWQRYRKTIRLHAYQILGFTGSLFVMAIISFKISNYFLCGFLISLYLAIVSKIIVLNWRFLYFLSFISFLVLVLCLALRVEPLLYFWLGFSLNLMPFNFVFHIFLLRIAIYPFQVVWLFFNPFSKTHPIIWDELGFMPLPRTSQCLFARLENHHKNGLKHISEIVGNPFYLLDVHNASWLYLETTGSPVEYIYHWAIDRQLDRYAKIPIEPVDWEFGISSREVLFAQLFGLSINSLGDFNFYKNSFFQPLDRIFLSEPPIELLKLVGIVYQHIRNESNSFYASVQHSEDLYSHMLKLPNEQKRVVQNRLNLFQRSLDFEIQLESELDLDNYPYGVEVRQSFSNISTYLQFQNLEEIAAAPTHLIWLNPTDTFLRPTVIQALQTLSTISQSVHRANIASSPINQRNAILVANDALEQLTTYVTENVHPNYPEQKLLLRIIDQWQSIITKAGGELGRAELLEPIENPYIAGPPVTGHLFVGREDILTQLEELWLRPGQVESVVIFGHRRMGKTSILRNLPGRLTPTTHIINFNIQTLGTLNTQQLILALAQTLYDDLPTHIHIPEPTAVDFPTPEPDFRRWLKKLEPQLQKDDRFIIAIDEFELIEQGIQDGRLSQSLIGHWRGILNDFPWIIFAFAGLHTLQEMTQDYWNPLFGSVKKIPITFLSQPAATRLITNPSEDFPIDYDPDAIDRIYHLTHGQPYLTQLICQNLITRFNRQRFEEQREIEPRFTIDDVNTIINEPNFFNDGNAYFRGIWEQAQETHGEAQLAILQNLVDRPLTQPEFADRTNLPPDRLDEALKLLIEHDVIQPNDQAQYHYRVELMRQWVLRLQ